MLLPLSHGALAVDYNICTSEDIKLLLGALNFLNSHYTEKALHKLAHYNNHFTLLCHDKTNYMQWLSWKVATPPHTSKFSRKSLLYWPMKRHSGGKRISLNLLTKVMEGVSGRGGFRTRRRLSAFQQVVVSPYTYPTFVLSVAVVFVSSKLLKSRKSAACPVSWDILHPRNSGIPTQFLIGKWAPP